MNLTSEINKLCQIRNEQKQIEQKQIEQKQIEQDDEILTNWKEYVMNDCIVRYCPDSLEDIKGLLSVFCDDRKDYYLPIEIALMKGRFQSDSSTDDIKYSVDDIKIPEYRYSF